MEEDLDIFNPEERNKLYLELIESLIHYIKIDLNEMCDKLDVACFPILMSVCTGVDFMGGLIYGFKNSSNNRSIKFIVNYMGKDKSSIYSSNEFADYIIKNLRNKLVHEALIYGHFESSKNKKDEKYHLTLMRYREDIEMLFIHPNKFRDDFFVGLTNFYHKLVEISFKNKIINNFSKRYDINDLYCNDICTIREKILKYDSQIRLPEVNKISHNRGTSYITSIDRKNDAIIKFITNYYNRNKI